MKSILKVIVVSSLLVFGSCANNEKKPCCSKGKCSLKREAANSKCNMNKVGCKGKCKLKK